MAQTPRRSLKAVVAAVVLVAFAGCTSPREYVRNGFKVGPNYRTPHACTAASWIDAPSSGSDAEPPTQWWTVFNDPVLDELIRHAATQNLTLREACFRVLQARASLAIATGSIFPQGQNVSGAYNRVAVSGANFGVPGVGSQFFDQWNLGFNLSWELDLWGRYRRAIAAAEDGLDASVAGYDEVLVTLLSDVATNYVQVRTFQERIRFVQENIELQRRILHVAQRRFEAGAKNRLDLAQAKSNLEQTEAQIPQFQNEIQQACNRLCVLLGITPLDLEQRLGEGRVPTAPTDVVLGVPADLLRRRPDVRRAERVAAALGEQIGIAESALYPIFAIRGTIGWRARELSDLFTSDALTGAVGPAFQWNILNYGRIQNGVRLQQARFQEQVAVYQNTVLRANAEVEDGLSNFLRAKERAALLDQSVIDSREAANIVETQFREGAVDFTRVAQIEQSLVQQQDLRVQAHGQIAQGLIQVYRALGGGWEVPIVRPREESVPMPNPVNATPPVEQPPQPSGRN